MRKLSIIVMVAITYIGFTSFTFAQSVDDKSQPYVDTTDPGITDIEANTCKNGCWIEWKPVCRWPNGSTTMGWRKVCIYYDCSMTISKWTCGKYGGQ